jgi:hypothetical protein
MNATTASDFGISNGTVRIAENVHVRGMTEIPTIVSNSRYMYCSNRSERAPSHLRYQQPGTPQTGPCEWPQYFSAHTASQCPSMSTGLELQPVLPAEEPLTPLQKAVSTV